MLFRSEELKCEFFKANVTKRQDWEELVRFADEKFGAIDAVVNNAGTTYRQKASPVQLHFKCSFQADGNSPPSRSPRTNMIGSWL